MFLFIKCYRHNAYTLSCIFNYKKVIIYVTALIFSIHLLANWANSLKLLNARIFDMASSQILNIKNVAGTKMLYIKSSYVFLANDLVRVPSEPSAGKHVVHVFCIGLSQWNNYSICFPFSIYYNLKIHFVIQHMAFLSLANRKNGFLVCFAFTQISHKYGAGYIDHGPFFCVATYFHLLL